MSDYRDPDYRDPNYRPGDYRGVPESSRGWSMATWGWIAGFAAVALLLILAFGMGGADRTAKDGTRTQTTTGQGTTSPAPPATTPAPTSPAK